MNTYPEYTQYEKLVYSAIHSVWRDIGGNLEEMLACSGMLFVKACQCYNEQRGMSIGAWIRKVVWDDTFSARRIDIGRSNRYEKGDFDLLAVEDKRSRFSLAELMEELSEDARNLVELSINPHNGIALKQDGVPKQSSLMAAARRLYGWSNEHLAEVCNEIRESL